MGWVMATAVARLRNGDWLDRRRMRLFAAVLLAAQIGFFLFVVAGTHGWIVTLTGPTTTDFVSFYAAGVLADTGTPALAYHQAAHLAAEENVTAAGIQYQFFYYPPVYLILCGVLAQLPYLLAFVAFAAATLAAYLLVMRRILDDHSGTALVVMLAFPSVFWNIGLGQNAFLTAALFGGATLLIDRRPIASGLLFGALCYKPHLGLLVPVALAAGGYWRAFAAAGVSVAGLVFASAALFGWQTWSDYLVAAGGAHSMYESGRILFAGFISAFGAVRLIGGDVTLAYMVQAGASLAAVVLVAVAWRFGLSLPVRAAALASATLVAAPLSLLYDLMLATIAVAWLVRANRTAPAPAWETTVLAALFVALLNARNLAEDFHLPMTFVAAIALFALVARRAWRELAAPSPAVVRPMPAGGGLSR